MKTYPNQKIITIDKPKTFPNFALYGTEEIAKACAVLNGSAFKVWCYLLSNSANVKWAISPSDAEINWGIKHSTWRDGINELKEKGFLDDKAIHILSTKDEYRLSEKTKSDHSKDDIQRSKDDNQHRNNINTVIKNTVCTNKSNNHPKENSFYDDDFEF